MPSAGHVEDSISIQFTTESQSDWSKVRSGNTEDRASSHGALLEESFPQMGAFLVKTETSGAGEEPRFLSVDRVRSL